jgi:hypothetical protein
MLLFRRRPNHPTEEELSACLDGELSANKQASVMEHLRACEACASLYEGFGATKALTASLPRAETRRSFVLGAEYARERAPAVAPRSPLAFAPAVALTLFVALVAVDLAVLPASETSRTDELASKATLEERANVPPPAVREAGGAAGATAQDRAALLTPMPAAAPAEAMPFSASTATATDAGTASGDDVAAPSQPEADRGLSVDGDEDRTWLRVLQAGALAAFVASLVAARWLRLKEKRGR